MYVVHVPSMKSMTIGKKYDLHIWKCLNHVNTMQWQIEIIYYHLGYSLHLVVHQRTLYLGLCYIYKVLSLS